MENPARILIWITLMVAPSFQQFPGFFPRTKPHCSNRTADIRFIDLNAELNPVVKFDTDGNGFSLFLEAKWTLNFSYFGSEIPLDGFAVHFMSVKEKRNHTTPNVSEDPTTPCISGSDHIWVRSSDDEACDAGATVNECKVTYPDFCLCPVSNCTLLPDTLNCVGTPSLLQDDQDYYQTVPSTVRSLLFPIEFHAEYEFAVTQYYRHFSNGHRKTFQAKIDNCESLLQNFTETQDEARQICCQHGARSLVAYNVSISESRPNFKGRANETTLNVTVNWLPPGDGSNVKRFFVNIHEQEAVTHFPEGTGVLKRPLPDVVASNSTNSSCANPQSFYEMEFYNLVPGVRYLIIITTSVKDEDTEKLCRQSRCVAKVLFVATDPANYCREDFSLCDPTATCESKIDPSTGRKATCNCGPGRVGDGLNTDIGTGCEEIDDCLTEKNSCADLAICTDLLADTGVECKCPDGFYGDASKTGSGCRSSRVTALAISLPIVAVLIIIVAVVTWYVVRERRKKRDQLLQRFIPCDNGILMSIRNPDAYEEKGHWDPSFGSKWEIDRKNLKFGKVLGRGNYGVVHLAWLSKDDKHAGNGFAGNGAYRDGEFYNPVSSKETDVDNYDKIDTNSTAVAVKSLQEGTRSHENLANFLEEIHFMLNIGDHENIVKIHGCTTTDEPVYLITEYLQYGDLLHFLWDAREASKRQYDPVYKVTEVSLCNMARDVARGMAYLQQIRVIHGDIAARNILVGENGICKLSDFGLAVDVYMDGWSEGDKEKQVPFKWISPERMMMGQVPITSKSDVWSYGNLMYEMFTLGCPPYPGIQPTELLVLLRSGYRMKKPNTCNDQVYDLMNKCWRWRASSRPTFAQLVKLFDNVIYQLQSRGNHVDMVAAVEELDREEYVNELRVDSPRKGNNYVNGNITVVENECDKQTRA